MPELPDLLYIRDQLHDAFVGKRVTTARLANPILLRALLEGDLSLLVGAKLEEITRVAHFLFFTFSAVGPPAGKQPAIELAVNAMLAGRFRVALATDKHEGSLGFALGFGDDDLRYLDDKQMGKVYLLPRGARET